MNTLLKAFIMMGCLLSVGCCSFDQAALGPDYAYGYASVMTPDCRSTCTTCVAGCRTCGYTSSYSDWY